MNSLHRTEDLLIKVQQSAPCTICGKKAHFVEISFESPICSPECAKQMWKQYVDTQISRTYKTLGQWLKEETVRK
jgi:hypothetical protein